MNRKKLVERKLSLCEERETKKLNSDFFVNTELIIVFRYAEEREEEDQ